MIDRTPGQHTSADGDNTGETDPQSGGDSWSESACSLEDRLSKYAPVTRRIAAMVARRAGLAPDDQQMVECAQQAMRDLLDQSPPFRGLEGRCQALTLRRYLQRG